MEIAEKRTIRVETKVNLPIEKIWSFWTEPKHITKWYNASDDWHAPYAENENPEEIQRDGWQNVLNNFKKYSESKK